MDSSEFRNSERVVSQVVLDGFPESFNVVGVLVHVPEKDVVDNLLSCAPVARAAHATK